MRWRRGWRCDWRCGWCRGWSDSNQEDDCHGERDRSGALVEALSCWRLRRCRRGLHPLRQELGLLLSLEALLLSLELSQLLLLLRLLTRLEALLLLLLLLLELELLLRRGLLCLRPLRELLSFE